MIMGFLLSLFEMILGRLFKKTDPAEQQVKEDDALAEFVEKQKDLNYRLRNDPDLAERLRVQLNNRK